MVVYYQYIRGTGIACSQAIGFGGLDGMIEGSLAVTCFPVCCSQGRIPCSNATAGAGWMPQGLRVARRNPIERGPPAAGQAGRSSLAGLQPRGCHLLAWRLPCGLAGSSGLFGFQL